MFSFLEYKSNLCIGTIQEVEIVLLFFDAIYKTDLTLINSAFLIISQLNDFFCV